MKPKIKPKQDKDKIAKLEKSLEWWDNKFISHNKEVEKLKNEIAKTSIANRELADENYRLKNLAEIAQREATRLREDLAKVKECRDFLKETIKSFNKVFKNSPAK